MVMYLRMTEAGDPTVYSTVRYFIESIVRVFACKPRLPGPIASVSRFYENYSNTKCTEWAALFAVGGQ